jgi:type II pantothenate kinase
MIAGIDFGSSMTDIVILEKGQVVFRRSFLNDDKRKRNAMQTIIKKYNPSSVHITGAYGVSMSASKKVDEIKAIGKGGLFVSRKKRALVVSIGSGTAIVSCNNTFLHMGGTATGGRTLMGLAELLIGNSDMIAVDKMAQKGNLSKVDLLIKDIYPLGIGLLGKESSAAHFGKLRNPSKNDLALGLVNMAAQSIGTIAVLAAKASGHKNIVLTGGLTKLKTFREAIKKRINVLSDIPVVIPPNASVATAIGAALSE